MKKIAGKIAAVVLSAVLITGTYMSTAFAEEMSLPEEDLVTEIVMPDAEEAESIEETETVVDEEFEEKEVYDPWAEGRVLAYEEVMDQMTYEEYLAYGASLNSTDDVEMMAMAYEPVAFSALNAPGVCVPQDYDGDGSCVLSAVTSMVRRAFMLAGDPYWNSVSKGVVGAACGGTYVKFNFSVSTNDTTVHVSNRLFSGGVGDLLSALQAHPEGIVIYCEGLQNGYGYSQHAVLLTDYTNGEFYCSEPIPFYFNKYGPRIPLTMSSLGRDCGSLASIVSHITSYWFVASPGGFSVIQDVSGIYQDSNATFTTSAVTGLKAVPAGNQVVQLNWNKKAGADGYAIYAKKGGVYKLLGCTPVTYYFDKMALYSDYNFYWVFAYKKYDTHMQMSSAPKYVYAKGVCAPVSTFHAYSGVNCVKLTWSAVKDAEGYLIYGRVNGGSYKYVGMTTRATSYIDTKAGKTSWSYYWVFPIIRDGNGKMIPGGASKYVYGKAK